MTCEAQREASQLHQRRARTLHLFAGAGGGILADILLEHRTVCAVEIDRFFRKVIKHRQKEGVIPWFPIFRDVRRFDGNPWKGAVDIVCAGFPCQPYSRAGNKKGAEDERNLWPDTLRVLREVGPSIALLENVPGLASFDYFGEILGDLGEAGFDAEWGIVSAASVGAPHLRERLWILAYSRSADSYSIGFLVQRLLKTSRARKHSEKDKSGKKPTSGDDNSVWGWWRVEPSMDRVVDGMADRVDRIKALGNGQVPLVAATAFLMLAERAEIMNLGSPEHGGKRNARPVEKEG